MPAVDILDRGAIDRCPQLGFGLVENGRDDVACAVPVTNLGPALVSSEPLPLRTGGGVAVPERITCRADFVDVVLDTDDLTELGFDDGAGGAGDEHDHAFRTALAREEARAVERVEPFVRDRRGVADVVQDRRDAQVLGVDAVEAAET